MVGWKSKPTVFIWVFYSLLISAKDDEFGKHPIQFKEGDPQFEPRVPYDRPLNASGSYGYDYVEKINYDEVPPGVDPETGIEDFTLGDSITLNKKVAPKDFYKDYNDSDLPKNILTKDNLTDIGGVYGATDFYGIISPNESYYGCRNWDNPLFKRSKQTKVDNDSIWFNGYDDGNYHVTNLIYNDRFNIWWNVWNKHIGKFFIIDYEINDVEPIQVPKEFLVPVIKDDYKSIK